METVVLESPGGSGMALVEGRKERGVDVKLVAPHAVRQGPGRTPAGKAGPWRHERHPAGFLRGAFRPEDEGGVVRSCLRQRRRRVAMASRTGQPRPKALEQRHRKRTEGVSESTGKAGMTLLRALRAGERAPQRLAPYRDPRCQHDHATSAQALTGHGRAAHLFALQQAVAP
jgi:hypothetical protein